MSASVPTPIPTDIPISGPIAITGPLSIIALLDRTFRAMRARFGILMLSAIIVMAPIGILTVLLAGRFMSGYLELFQFSVTQPGNPDIAPEAILGEMFGYFGAIMLLGLLYTLGSTLVTLISIHHIQRFLHGESSTVGEGWRAAIRRLLPMIGMGILQFLIVGLVALAILIAVGILFAIGALIFGGALSAIDSEAAGTFMMIGVFIVIFVGYLVMIVLVLAPIVYFMARWLAAVPILMIEELGPIQALQRSWALTKGQVWRGIAYLVLLTLISYFVIGLPLSVAQSVAMIVLPTQMALVGVIFTALSYLLNLFYQPFYATGVVLFYYDLRVRVEAYDVALRVPALEAEVAPDAPPA